MTQTEDRIEFLGGNDAFIWSIEGDARLRSTIVVLTLLDHAPDWQEVTNRFELISQTIPMFRRRVVPSPGLAPPRWEVDEEFDLSFHLRRVSAPAPGDMNALLEMARIAAMADFDRARPLWEATFIEGLADGGAALLCKLNHALTDGVGAVGIASLLFDNPGQHREHQAHKRIKPATSPGRKPGALYRELARGGVEWATDGLTASLKIPALVADGLRHPVGTVTGAGATVASLWRMVGPSSSRNSPIMHNRGRGRQLTMHQVDRQRLHDAGAAAGGSLNDAFIGAVGGGLRLYHEKHGATTESVVISMPINIRTPQDPPGGNRATLSRLDVPVGIADAAQRIKTIHELTHHARKEKSLGYAQLVAGGLRLAPRWYVSSTFRKIDFIGSDVPGFPMPVHLAGAPVRMQYAFSPTLGAAFNITLLTYGEICSLAINVDNAAIPDIDTFHDCIVAGFDEVLALAP